jgi:hypothetical protein
LSEDQRAELARVVEAAAQEIKERIIANEDTLEPIVKKLVTEIMTARWNSPERKLTR